MKIRDLDLEATPINLQHQQLAAFRICAIVASRVEKRVQICPFSRRIAGLCKEKTGKYGPFLPLAQQISLKSDWLLASVKRAHAPSTRATASTEVTMASSAVVHFQNSTGSRSIRGALRVGLNWAGGTRRS